MVLVCLLALAVTVSPAAQAFACTCGDVEVAGSTCCGCCADRASCGCCAAETDDAEPAMDGGCACTHTAPRTGAVAPILLAPPVATDALALARVRVHAAPAPAPERRDPHPEVVLPLLV